MTITVISDDAISIRSMTMAYFPRLSNSDSVVFVLYYPTGTSRTLAYNKHSGSFHYRFDDQHASNWDREDLYCP